MSWARADRLGAVLEDLGYGNAMYWSGPEAPIHALWTAITMPALVLRARQEILPGFGFILPAAEAERFAAAVPSARRGGRRRESLHDHGARRFHRRHRRVPAHELTPSGEVTSETTWSAVSLERLTRDRG